MQMLSQAKGAEKAELERLLALVAQGDREAFAALYERTRAAVYAAALGLVKDAEEAREIAQDTFVQVWESAGRYRAQGTPMAWILTVARNLAKMRLRARRDLSPLEEADWNALPAFSPGVTQEERILLQQALATLGDGERQIVLLHAVSGLRHREIAALLELPLSTVLSRYHRALKKLRTWMEGEDVR